MAASNHQQTHQKTQKKRKVAQAVTVKSPLIYCYLLLSVVYFFFPLGKEVTSGSLIYLYKSAVSVFAILGIFVILGKTKTAYILSSFEILAIITQILTYFTAFAHHFHSAIVDLSMVIFHNYQEIPRWLYIAQVLTLAIVGTGGICKALGVNIKRCIHRYRNSRGGYNRLSQIKGSTG